LTALATVVFALLPAVAATAAPADEIAAILARVPLRPETSSEQALRDWSKASDADFEAYHLLAIHGSKARRTEAVLESFRSSLGSVDAADVDSGAVVELAAASPFGLRFEWNDGRLAALSDIGMRRRGLSPTLLATEFLKTFQESLAQLLRLSPHETLAVSAVEFGDGVSMVEAAHLIDGIPVRSSNVQLFISGPTHYFGPDVLIEVHFNLIGADFPAPVDLIASEELPALAEQTLLDSGFQSVVIEQSAPLLVVCCRHLPCHHAYLMFATADNKRMSVEIDAYGGNLVSTQEMTVESAGDIKYKGPIAYDSTGNIPPDGAVGDAFLPWMYGSIWDSCNDTTCTAPYITDTDSNGHYDGSGGTGLWWIGMVSKEMSAGPGRVTRVLAGSDRCNGTTYRQPIAFNPGSNVNQTWATSVARNAGLAYYWANYGLSAVDYESLEVPDLIYLEAETAGGAGSMSLCAGDTFHIEGYLGYGFDAYLHYLWTHEFGHTFAYCAAITGDGCRYVHPTGYKLMEAFSEGAADLSTLWLTKGRYLPNLSIPYYPYTPDFTWGGTDTTAGDDYIDYYEILRKTCTADNQCTSNNCFEQNWFRHMGNPDTTLDDTYSKCFCSSSADCDAGQTCAPNNNLCHKSCATDQDCRTYFGMDSHVFCSSNRCSFHGKFNNRMFVNMWNRLRLHIGWERAIKYIYKAMAGVTETTTYAERAGSHYEKLKAQATWEKFEVARAFSSVKPTFASWPDDMSNNWWVAPHLNADGPWTNITRVPWDPGAYTQFDYAGDTDYFTFRARPGEDYRVWTSYTSAGVDACISIYQWSSAHGLAARDTARCFDGLAGGSDLTWSGDSSGGWYLVRISNEAGGAGSYRINLQMQGDDHADWSWSNLKWRDAEPIANAQSTLQVTVEENDTDYFKINVPNDASITAMDIYLFTTQGDPVLYLDWGGNEANASAPVLRAYLDQDYVRYNVPANERGWYYIDIENSGATTVQTVLYVVLYCGASLCTSQYDFGSRTSPYLIEIPWGNTLAQSLYNAADEDWYAIDLQESEHASINVYGSYDECSLQLSLYADEDQPYYNCDGGCTVPSGAGTPQYVMRQVGFGADAFGSNLHYIAEKDGRYYIKVASGDGQACSAYTLSVAHASLGTQTNPLWDYQTPEF
jgi:hypothetical protein